MRKKIILSVTTLSAIILMSGCGSATLSPDVAFKQGINKTFESKGYNYTGSFNVDRLSLKEDKSSSMPFNSKKIEALSKGAILNVSGAVDIENAKEESLIEYGYHKDNVDVSIKIPILMDFNAQTLYVGNSILHTFLPETSEYQNKLLKFDLSQKSDLLKDLNMSSDESAMVDKLFSKEWYQKSQKLSKESLNKAFADINATSFSKNDKNQVVLKLNNEESTKVITTIMNTLLSGGIKEMLPPKEAKDMESFTPMLEMMMGMFKTQTQVTTQMDKEGRISNLTTKLNLMDANNTEFDIDLKSNIVFSNFDKPVFLIDTNAPFKLLNKQSFTEIFDSNKASYEEPDAMVEESYQEPVKKAPKKSKKSKK